MYLFPTLVIKSVSQFMSHDYSNSTEVKSSERHGKNTHILKMYIWQHKNFETFVFMVLKLVKAIALIRLSEKINAHTVHKYEAVAI